MLHIGYMDQRLPEEAEVYEIIEGSALYDSFSKNENPSYAANYALNLYTKNLVRKLLVRDPITELEFRSIPQESYVLCEHGEYNCACKKVVTISNTIALMPTYETGLRLLRGLVMPGMDIDPRVEGKEHINISSKSKSILGRELCDFLTERFKVYSDVQTFTSLEEISGSSVHRKGRSELPTVIKNGDIDHNNTYILKLALSRLEYFSELKEALIANTLPIYMYRTLTDTKEPMMAIDLDDAWLADMFMDITEILKSKNHS